MIPHAAAVRVRRASRAPRSPNKRNQPLPVGRVLVAKLFDIPVVRRDGARADPHPVECREAQRRKRPTRDGVSGPFDDFTNKVRAVRRPETASERLSK